MSSNIRNKTRTSAASRKKKTEEIVMSQRELAELGGGRIAYIKVLSSDEAKRMYPAVEGVPSGINLYALQAADGTPIALTDTLQAALGHAMGDELEIASLH